MTTRLILAGMDPSNPPVGFAGGLDLPSLAGKNMTCVDVVLLAEVDEDEDEIVEFHPSLPYGFLKIESEELPPNSFVAIINKVDFRNAWELQHLQAFEPSSLQVNISYKPWKLMPKMFPHFEFLVIGSKGQVLSRYYGLER